MRESPSQMNDRTAVDWWRLGLQLGLVICAGLLLVTRPYLLKAVRANEVASFWLLVGPLLFLMLFVATLALEFFAKRTFLLTGTDYIQASFGIFVIVLLFPSSLREYRVRQIPDPMSLELIQKFSNNKDAGIRALAMLASSRHKINDPALGALIHRALLDKDPLVQQAAKLVIEDNFGIRLKNGAEGIHQAQLLITDVGSSALLMRKGSP